MASATQRALAKRAIGAAEFMEQWAKWIEKEATDQNVVLLYSNATMTLSAETIGEMVYGMRTLCSDIRQLDRNLTVEKVRGRGHP